MTLNIKEFFIDIFLYICVFTVLPTGLLWTIVFLYIFGIIGILWVVIWSIIFLIFLFVGIEECF